MSSEKNKALRFNEWVESHTEEMFRWAYYKTSSKETAEDLVQDTFYAAYKSYDGFENRSNVKTWLFSILNNKIVDFYKKKPKQVDVSFSEEKGNEITDGLFTHSEGWTELPVHPVWNEEQHLLDNPDFNEVLEKCMNDLPENWREAVSLKYVLNKKGAEITQYLGISSANYWQIIHRSKLLLKKCVEYNWSI